VRERETHTHTRTHTHIHTHTHTRIHTHTHTHTQQQRTQTPTHTHHMQSHTHALQLTIKAIRNLPEFWFAKQYLHTNGKYCPKLCASRINNENNCFGTKPVEMRQAFNLISCTVSKRFLGLVKKPSRSNLFSCV